MIILQYLPDFSPSNSLFLASPEQHHTIPIKKIKPTISTRRLVPAPMPTAEAKITGIQTITHNAGPPMSKSLIDISFTMPTTVNIHKKDRGNDRKVTQETSAKLFKLDKLGMTTIGLMK